MRLFDCTLRDGANVVGNGFDAKLTESMIKGLLSSGITEIEFGNAKGMGAYEYSGAQAPLTDLEYLQMAAPYMKAGNLGMFIQAKYADQKYVQMAAEHGLNFLRVGMVAGYARNAKEAIMNVKQAGLTCRYSQMKGYICTPLQLAEEAKLLEDYGVDVVTIMDSAGTMMPDEVSEYVEKMKQAVSIPVGFHGHNNMGLSQANALAAIKAGADEIDCGLLGMARSCGNCSTELTAALLYKSGYYREELFFNLLNYLNKELIPEMKQYDYYPAVCPDDLILGISGCHSAFFKMFVRIAEQEQVDLYKLILEVSKIEKNKPEENLLQIIAQEIKFGDK